MASWALEEVVRASVTIKQVANDAGVSIATVSRVLNQKGPVQKETRRRILAVARRLRYVPHGAARSLITNRTNTLGVFLPDMHGEFFSEIIRGIDRASRGRGYHLLVSSSHSNRTEIEALLRATRGRVDGLVIMTPEVDARSLQANLPDTMPIVLLNSPAADGSFDSISIDNYGGALAVVEHLVELGHTRIAIITGPENNYDAQERLRGYRDALRVHGIPSAQELELAGRFNEESGYLAGARLLKLRPRPNAVFAANDAMAIGALSALHDAGLRVPDDIALAGFDDIPISRFVSPPLTTVGVAIVDLGARAVDCLLHAVEMKNRHVRRRENVATHLVVRESCGGGYGRAVRRPLARRQQLAASGAAGYDPKREHRPHRVALASSGRARPDSSAKGGG